MSKRQLLPKETSTPLLPPARAFVVQFQGNTDFAQQRVLGRIEHILSGKTGYFRTTQGLLGFMNRILTLEQKSRVKEGERED